MDFLKKHSFLAFLLLLGAAVRFYGLFDIPMDSDELGALFRAENTQSSFSKHLSDGVAIDGHPAGVQTLLWFLFKAFGFDEWKYKLLWGAFSVLNLVLFFRFAKQTSLHTAQFSSLLLAFLYLPVSMSVWVRPYELGFTALLLFLNYRKHSNPWVVGFLLSLTLYSHYFSFLAAVVFWMVDEELKLKRNTIIIALTTLLLAIPQWGILKHQVSEGGLSWLGKPQTRWFIDHVYYIFNQSNLITLFVLSCTAIVIIKRTPMGTESGKMLLTWALILLIGWTYSVWFKPVLQHHVVYFALPFFLIFLGNYSLSILPSWGGFPLFALLLISLTSETNYHRRRTQNKYASPFKFISEDPKLRYLAIVADGPNDLINYQSHKRNLTYIDFESLEKKSPEKTNDTFIFISNSGSPDWMLPWLETRYKRVNLFQSQLHSGISSSWFTVGGRMDAFTFNQPPMGDASLTLRNDSNVFVELKNLNLNLQQNDWIYFVIEPPTSDTFEFITALFEPGFNKALNQIDYRYSIVPGFRKPMVHTLKLEDIPNSSIQSVLRYNLKSNKPTRASVKLKTMGGNPWQYDFPRDQILTF